MFTLLIMTALWLFVGAVTLLLLQRLMPEWYFELERQHADATKTAIVERWVRPTTQPYDFFPRSIDYVGTILFWPAALVIGAVQKASNSNLNSMNTKRKLREELEKELAEAKKQIDELLRNN